MQIPLAGVPASAPLRKQPGWLPDAARAVSDVVQDYRARLVEVVDRAALPHDLPPAIEALTATPRGDDRAQEAGPGPCVQTHGLRLSRRIGDIYATPPDGRESHGGNQSRRRNMEPQHHGRHTTHESRPASRCL